MISERTINGKSIKEVEEKLQEPLDSKAYGMIDNQYPYIKVKSMEDRFDEVVGIFNYELCVGAPKVEHINDRVCFTVQARITVKFDDGSVCTIKEGVGTQNLTYRTGEGTSVDEISNVANDIDVLMSNAKKACLNEFKVGIKGLPSVPEKPKKKQYDNSNVGKNVKELSGNSGKTGSSGNQNIFKVTVKGSVESRGNRGYAVLVELEDGTTATMTIWNSQLQGKSLDAELLIQDLKPGVTMYIYGETKTYKDTPQINFLSFANNESEGA